jgi:hypothetical protein
MQSRGCIVAAKSICENLSSDEKEKETDDDGTESVPFIPTNEELFTIENDERVIQNPDKLET